VNDDLKQIVLEGLSGDNLRLLGERCRSHMNTMPAIYVTLGLMFKVLADEYDEQGTTATRFNAVTEALSSRILSLLNAESQSVDVILERLNDVCRGFHEVMETDLS